MNQTYNSVGYVGILACSVLSIIYALRIGSEYLRFAFLQIRSLSVRILTIMNSIAIEAIVEFYLLNSMWWNQNLERIWSIMCSLSYAYSSFWIARTYFNVFYVSVRVSSNFGAKFSIRKQCGGFTAPGTVKNGNFAKLASCWHFVFVYTILTKSCAYLLQ